MILKNGIYLSLNRCFKQSTFHALDYEQTIEYTPFFQLVETENAPNS